MTTFFWKFLVAVVGSLHYRRTILGCILGGGLGGKATGLHKHRLRSPNLQGAGGYSYQGFSPVLSLWQGTQRRCWGLGVTQKSAKSWWIEMRGLSTGWDLAVCADLACSVSWVSLLCLLSLGWYLPMVGSCISVQGYAIPERSTEVLVACVIMNMWS